MGSVLRYLIGLRLGGTEFPWGTLVVNVAGCFLLGFTLTWGLVRLPPAVTTPLAVGLLGGFTTFSTFAWEGLQLSSGSPTWLAPGYLLTSVVGGLAAAILGRIVGQALL